MGEFASTRVDVGSDFFLTQLDSSSNLRDSQTSLLSLGLVAFCFLVAGVRGHMWFPSGRGRGGGGGGGGGSGGGGSIGSAFFVATRKKGKDRTCQQKLRIFLSRNSSK